MEEILGLGKLSKFDYYGRPLREIFTNKPDLTPYVALKPEQRLDELNPTKSPNAQASLELDSIGLMRPMRTRSIAFFGVIKGGQPYPGAKRMSSLAIAREH